MAEHGGEKGAREREIDGGAEYLCLCHGRSSSIWEWKEKELEAERLKRKDREGDCDRRATLENILLAQGSPTIIRS